MRNSKKRVELYGFLRVPCCNSVDQHVPRKSGLLRGKYHRKILDNKMVELIKSSSKTQVRPVINTGPILSFRNLRSSPKSETGMT